MLNRRILRVKSMQFFFAYRQCKEANYNMALENLKQTFTRDLNAEHPRDEKELATYRKTADELFKKHFTNSGNIESQEANEEVRVAVQNSREQYRQQLKKDQDFLCKRMISETEKIYDHYILILLLLIELGKASDFHKSKQESKLVKNSEVCHHSLSENSIIRALSQWQALINYAEKANISWDQDRQTVRDWYKKIVFPDSKVQAYLQSGSNSPEDDLFLVQHIYKELILKHEVIGGWFAEKLITWDDDLKIIRSMLNKTIKKFSNNPAEGVELNPLAINWEDDKQFFQDLFKIAVENFDYFNELIAPITANWSLERITDVDLAVLKLALCEMLYFPSIPVKVTINEYVETAKHYSTPASKQFVNGVLDALNKQLSDKGLIKKSGRGLIDNK